MFQPKKKIGGIVICPIRETENSSLWYVTTRGKLRKLHKHELELQVKSPCKFHLPNKLGFFAGKPCILLETAKATVKIVLFAKDRPIIILINRTSFEPAPKNFYINYSFIYVDKKDNTE